MDDIWTKKKFGFCIGRFFFRDSNFIKNTIISMFQLRLFQFELFEDKTNTQIYKIQKQVLVRKKVSKIQYQIAFL
jgi:hypothetical protein